MRKNGAVSFLLKKSSWVVCRRTNCWELWQKIKSLARL